MQDLVTGLGINRASLYDTFGDKRTLFLRSLREYGRQTRYRRNTLLRQPRPAAELLRELLENIVLEILADTQQAKGCFMVNSATELAPHDAEVAQLVRDNQQDFETELTALLALGQAAGNITRAQPPQVLAGFVFTVVGGLQVQGKLGPLAETLRGVVDVALAALVTT
jgi:TetR/AcrR family transcriptional regulator, transcriptional repressor for nem operon